MLAPGPPGPAPNSPKRQAWDPARPLPAAPHPPQAQRRPGGGGWGSQPAPTRPPHRCPRAGGSGRRRVWALAGAWGRKTPGSARWAIRLLDLPDRATRPSEAHGGQSPRRARRCASARPEAALPGRLSGQLRPRGALRPGGAIAQRLLPSGGGAGQRRRRAGCPAGSRVEVAGPALPRAPPSPSRGGSPGGGPRRGRRLAVGGRAAGPPSNPGCSSVQGRPERMPWRARAGCGEAQARGRSLINSSC